MDHLIERTTKSGRPSIVRVGEYGTWLANDGCVTVCTCWYKRILKTRDHLGSTHAKLLPRSLPACKNSKYGPSSTTALQSSACVRNG